MRVEVLVAAMFQEPEALAEKMRLATEAVIINQCDGRSYTEFERKGRKIRCISVPERGVGKSRNRAVSEAQGDICLFADEDIIYEDGYEEKILSEFRRNPQADMIVFNVEVEESRRTYHIAKRGRVRFYNCGRYGAVSFAVRRDRLLQARARFSELFGGGAKYSSGEDSLFIKELLDRGFRVYTAPVNIGREEAGESTWFSGYHDKFFFDRGVLYTFLYGRLARPMALRFLFAHRKKLLGEKTFPEAYRQMKNGIRQGRKELAAEEKGAQSGGTA